MAPKKPIKQQNADKNQHNKKNPTMCQIESLAVNTGQPYQFWLMALGLDAAVGFPVQRRETPPSALIYPVC